MSQSQPPDGVRPDSGDYPLAPDTPASPPFAHGTKHREPVRPGAVPEIPTAQCIRVSPIEYQGVPDPAFEPRLHKGFQFLLGLGFVYAYVIGSFFSSLAFPQIFGMLGSQMLLGFGIALIVLIRVKTRWTGFIPGVLCAVFSLPIIGLVILGILCGGFRL